MARIGRHKRVGPYKGGMGRTSSYLGTSVSYRFDGQEVLSLLKSDKHFLEAALSGKYTYINGRVVLKSPECFELYTGKTVRLSTEDCFDFLLGKEYKIYGVSRTLKQRTVAHARKMAKPRVKARVGGGSIKYQRGHGSGVDVVAGWESRGGSSSHSEKKTTSKFFTGLQQPERFQSLGAVDYSVMQTYLNEEDASFIDKLESYIQEKDMTNEKLAEYAGVSPRTIQRMRNEKGYRPTLKTIVAVCLSLHLFPMQSYQLIYLAGYHLTSSPEEKVYCMLIDMLYTCEMVEINAFMLQFCIGNFEPKNK